MYYPSLEPDYDQNRLNELLLEAEQQRLIRAVQANKPSLLTQLQAHLAAWMDSARPQRKRTQRT